jgi:hypothetical protein
MTATPFQTVSIISLLPHLAGLQAAADGQLLLLLHIYISLETYNVMTLLHPCFAAASPCLAPGCCRWTAACPS